MVKSLTGPQEIELELAMELFKDGYYQGNAMAKLFIYVSEYDF
jgi:fibulin 1/2